MVLTALAPTHAAPPPLATPPSSTVRLPDRFDVHQVSAFEELVTLSVGDLVVDLTGVRFLDQTGLEALQRAQRTCSDEGRSLRLENLSTAARITFELTGLAPMLLGSGWSRPRRAAVAA